MKFKERFKSIIGILKKVFYKFPLTIISIFLYSMFSVMMIWTEFISDEVFENITFFILYFVFGSFFSEAIFKKLDLKKIISYSISAIISIVFVTLQNLDIDMKILWKILVCYVITLGISSIYILFKKSKKDINEYLLKLCVNIEQVTIIYGVLAIGIAIISSIFTYLILDKWEYKLLLSLEILLLGFFYIPRIMYCFVDMEEEVNKFFKGLVKYVLTSLVIIAFVIIYMYIIKILILRNMPKNQIFRILSALFIIGMPIWTMMQYYKDESIWYKLSLKLPIAFIPFIFLQIYTIGIRISENGITPSRYMCVALIVFEIIYVLIYILKKEKVGVLLLVGNVIIIVSLLIPVINMFKVSDMSQANKLRIFKEKDDYTDDEKKKIYGAYKYLEFSEDGKKYINDILTESDIKEIRSYNTSSYNNSSIVYISSRLSNSNVLVDGYKYLYFVRASDYSRENSLYYSVDEAFKNIEFKNDNYSKFLDNNDKYTINIDLQDEFEEYINRYLKYGSNDMNKYFESHNEIEFDNKKIVLKYFSIRYDEDSKEIRDYTIQGYLLEK